MLFGFALNHINGSTDYVLISAPDRATAESELAAYGPEDKDLESVVYYDPEAIVSEQYNDLAYLSSNSGVF
jgi:hypothetical protein